MRVLNNLLTYIKHYFHYKRYFLSSLKILIAMTVGAESSHAQPDLSNIATCAPQKESSKKQLVADQFYQCSKKRLDFICH